MSVYGGDSWAREAQYRKRRIDDLIIEGIEASSYKRLPSGKFVCLVCPNNPVLDTPTMISTHVNGSRHRAAELKRKDRELAMREEVNKRLAVVGSVNTSATTNASNDQHKTTNKPLIERARKAALEVVSGGVIEPEVKLETGNSLISSCEDSGHIDSSIQNKGAARMEQQPIDYREIREKELKFTAAGWKRDGYGWWYRDENVEFDSDDEDPNIVLNRIT